MPPPSASSATAHCVSMYMCCWLGSEYLHMQGHSFMDSVYAFQPADWVLCSRHFMAALQPALSWVLHHVDTCTRKAYDCTGLAGK